MTASPLPIGWWTSGIQSSGRHRSPRRRASLRKASAVSVTVSAWPTFSRTAVGSGTVLEGRRPRISGHSQASCTPYELGNHTRIRPARGRVIRSASPASRNRASRRLVCSMRTPGAITQCICSVVAIRYWTSTASASRSPPPTSTFTFVPTGSPASCPVQRCCGAARTEQASSRPRPETRPPRPDHGHDATTPPLTRPVSPPTTRPTTVRTP